MKRITLLLLVCHCLLAGAASAASVGFEEVEFTSGAEPPLAAGIWYPTEATGTEHALGTSSQIVATDAPIAGRDLPLVVISHGGG